MTNRDINYHKDSFILNQPGQKGRVAALNASHQYSLPLEDISLPAAVIKQSALRNNLDWMQRFAQQHGVHLCPHGKTTMTPDFFQQQLDHGAWGITVATPAQAEVAALAGAQRIIMANQLVGRTNMAIIANLIREHDIEFFCCADSLSNLDQLDTFFQQQSVNLNVLLEYGVEGGRCGCRTAEAMLELADAIQGMPALTLRGIEVYEGVIHGDNAEQHIRHFLTETLDMTVSLAMDGLIEGKPIVTGAGSAWYDVVAETFAFLDRCIAVIRPGCYAIHDTGIYFDAQNKVMARAHTNKGREHQGKACDLGGDLHSALEVWAYVISRPEPNKLVVGMGKRDVAFDAGLPIAERGYRNGKPISVQGLTATAVMDQHTFITVSEESGIDVGDVIAFSTSHPCLTFDKWRYIAMCDDNYVVRHWVETCF
ncbi:amino acid deaminase [Thaumasiovibrio subtropicus]|uniref:amino acid deaminase n=1 Tax=Thaumasiovibrio subtropicus TaxID=1891207 RepID=UPI000B360897|nr:amino acid deaminase [Thaumasiovibrio subtropicus]